VIASTYPLLSMADARDAATLVDLLRWRAQRQPEQPLYTFLPDGDTEEIHITYAELDRQARAIAAHLQEHGAAGQQVLLLCPPGVEYIAAFFGCLYAGAVAVPAYPPDPLRLNRTLPRLQAIMKDSGATFVLTTSFILAIAGSLFEQAPDLATLTWIAVDAISVGTERHWREPELSAASLAFLQYTSGSTGAPRGVMLSYENLLANQELIVRSFELTSRERMVSWLPPYHDMGLIGGILQPLYSGYHCVLMSPIAFLQHPFRWLQAISRYQATVSGGPNFAYNLCIRKATPERLASLDLTCWEVAFNGAEPVRAETLARFADTFAPCGFRREAFYPCYGLAEATLLVGGARRRELPTVLPVQTAALEQHRVVAHPADGQASSRLVSCGYIRRGVQLAIVDPATRTCREPERVGEIWVAGPSIARGYWRQPQQTEDVFQARLADSHAGPFLRTGDLGFLRDGELFVTGRMKDLIIINGRNHYPQDIEATAERSHPAIRSGCSVAFSIDVHDQEHLVIAVEVERGALGAPRQPARAVERAGGSGVPAIQIVADAIRRAVHAEHDLHVHDVVLLKKGSISKTSSGKIQRHACRAGYLAGTLDVLDA
jgi:acyl-CoA synthetase (AMP-forming)/AMP-acid ligase II